jgi:hypothetical protein
LQVAVWPGASVVGAQVSAVAVRPSRLSITESSVSVTLPVLVTVTA